ncbi:MAG: hypothetical protein AAF938_12010 [Myxococcota bacterium]
MRRMLLVLLIGACSSDRDSNVPDAAAMDAPSDIATDAPSEAGTDAAIDAAEVDAAETAVDAAMDGPSDGAVEVSTDLRIDAAGDAAMDAADMSADATDDAAECTYLDDLFITDCPSGFERFRRFVDRSDPDACPEYFLLNDTRYETLEDAFATEGCLAECVRAPSTSVTLLRCGRRTGYITFEDAAGCDPASVIETSDGIFRDAAEWDEAAPCE